MDTYEKKYNEALERFKSFKEKYYTKDTNLGDVIFDKTGEMQKDFESIFPQLRESDDERIRKELIEFIKWSVDRHFMREDFHQAKRPSEWIAYLEKQKENPKNAISIPADCMSDAKCEDRSQKHTDSFGTDIRDTPAYWRGWDDAMKQKEQKPAEWEDYKDKVNIPYCSSEPEWSEEDEKMLSDLRNTLGCLMNAGAITFKTKKKFSNWLKSLHPNK